MSIPDEIESLRIEVTGDESGAMFAGDFPLSSGWPQSLTLLPAEDPNEGVTIVVRGMHSSNGGGVVVQRTVMARFREGRNERVEIVLPRDCLFVMCGEGYDCVGGNCVLPDGPDGGRDAGADASVSDGHVDAGPECESHGDCNDSVDCTSDSCAAGVCVNTPDDSVCEADATCDPVSGCPARPCTDDAECDDALPCNGTEICFEGLCARGVAPDCSDGVDCTTDSCDDSMGGCVHMTDDTACDDGSACNGAEICSLTEGCIAGDPLSCDDMDDCTAGLCDDTAAMCVFTTRDADMDGHGSTACSEIGGVPADDCDDTEPAIFPGAVEICNGRDDDCDATCDDGFTCCAGSTGGCTTSCGSTGTRTCSSSCAWSVCVAPPEICNGADDDCNGACDDGFGCCQGEVVSCTTSCGTTGTQTCDGGCNVGACVPPFEDCNSADDDCDGLVDESACGACLDDPDCDDGNVCNGAELCDRGGCSPGTALTCDDGVRCTVDGCDPTAGCTHTPDNRFCDDANFCNGAEMCTATGCQPGTAPSCDDGNACTDDSCGGASPGSCTHTTRDADGDEYGDTACPSAGGVPNTDCDDTRSSVFPDAPEACNGRDDDCDTLVDETFTCARGATGSCTTSCGTTGSRVCGTACSWGVCSPPPETCNGTDDDCNGVQDDGFACVAGSTRSCTTSCGSTGSQSCSTSSCTWDDCVAPAESCNGLDDDCDGTADEDFTCVIGETTTCTTSCGTTGSRTCDSTCSFGSCQPPPEACNGIDDDCDGVIDDGVECTSGATQSCTTSCGSTGSQTCTASCTWDACVPPSETCNGADDDCDGTRDDGFTCVQGTTGSCTASCGTTGSRTCQTDCTWGTCTPPGEVCNASDDDCDGLADDGFTCVQGSSGSCTTSCGSTGSRTCRSDCTWGSCAPPAEVCNGSDDDCDGLIDETFTCVPGSTGSCTASCGTGGSRTCTSSCEWGTCNPPSESCNGFDDDCDSVCDDGFTCCAGSSGSCTTSCGTTGSRTCTSSCGWSVCSPPAEICNGADDDCDGACDDGFACCAGAMGSCTTTCGSTGSRSCSASCGWGTCNAPAETCNGADDDCDGACDDGFTCCAGTTQSCTTSCGSTGTETCTASCGWGSCAPPAETCNGVDDNCDGTVDEGCGGCSNCSGATTVSAPGGRHIVNLEPHVHNGTGSCNTAAGSEAYLTFTLSATSDVFITTHHAALDTLIYVRSCSCTGTQVGCNDDADGLTSSALVLRDLPADTYNVFIDTKAAMSASVAVDLFISSPGTTGDRCGDPVPIPSGSAMVDGNTCGFAHDYDLSLEDECSYSAGGNAEDRVYYFYLPTTTSVTFDGCNAGTDYDTEIYVREVCNVAGLENQVACNGDGCGGAPNCTNKYRSAMTRTLGPGLYYFMVDGYETGSWSCPCGNYQFDLSGI